MIKELKMFFFHVLIHTLYIICVRIYVANTHFNMLRDIYMIYVTYKFNNNNNVRCVWQILGNSCYKLRN